MDEHGVIAREGSDLGVVDGACSCADLLDEVHDEAARERDANIAGAEETNTGEANELSPDEILRQLDAVTLSGDDDGDAEDSDHNTTFEDAHEELHPDLLADADVGDIHEAAELVVEKEEDESSSDQVLTEEGVSRESGHELTTSVAAPEPCDSLPEKSLHHINDAEIVENSAKLVVQQKGEHAESDNDESNLNDASTTDETTPITVDSGAENYRTADVDAVTGSPNRNAGDDDRNDLDEDPKRTHEGAEQAIEKDKGEASRVEVLANVEDAKGGNGSESAHPGDLSDDAETSSEIQDLPLGNETSAADSVVKKSSEKVDEVEGGDFDQINHLDEEDADTVLHERQASFATEKAPLADEATVANTSISLPDALVASGNASDGNLEGFHPGAVGDTEPDNSTACAGFSGAEVENADSDVNEFHDIALYPEEASSALSALDGPQEETQEAIAASDPKHQDLVFADSDLEPVENGENDTGDATPESFTDHASDLDAVVRKESGGPENSSNDSPPELGSETVEKQLDGDLGDSDAGQEAYPSGEREGDLQVLPPPAPSSLAVVVGSMNPAGTEDDEDSDSQDEDNGEQSLLPPPLNLDNLADDDDDELEIDPAVVNTIEIEKQPKTSKANSLETAGIQEKESGLLAALPGIKPTASTDDIEFSFADEIRVAHVVVPSTGVEMPSKPPTKLESHEDSTENVFGIGYTSLKKKRDGADSAESDGYSISTAPAFPDEKEFENELGLSTDLVFSVKSMKDNKNQADDNDDDEFGPVTAPSPDEFSPDILEARRALLQAQKAQEEEAIINELKKATDEEKSINETVKTTPDGASSTFTSDATTPESESALSLKELHGIYKRGLGDQGVLLLDEDEESEEKPSKPHQTTAQSGTSPPLSVMGRILSKSSILDQAITEEDDEEEEDGNDTQGGTQVAHEERETLIDYAAEHEDAESSTAVDEWKEIQLTNHGSGKNSGQVASEPNNTEQQTRSQRESNPIANFKISYNEAFQYCLQADEFLLQLDKIVAEDFGEGGRSCFSCFSPRPRLAFPGAMDERDRVFCIAATSYDPRHEIFTRVLQTLYVKLTRTQREVPLSGTHWEDIGFQGNDPSTDLRGCGVLSLLQMLYLVDKHPELALRFHSLSQHPTRHFPLACALINVTLQSVMALRSGALYKECNKQGSVFKAINSFYVALASALMNEIQTSSDEIPIIIKEVLDDGRSNPERVLEEFSKGDTPAEAAQSVFSPQKQASGGVSSSTGLSSTHIEFTEIVLQSAASDDED